MKTLHRALPILLGMIPALVLAQLDQIAILRQNVPDFGATSGSWGQIQYYRPLGVKGIILEDWKDLGQIHPLSGEPLNTDRQGWFPLPDSATLWEQVHPILTSPADTLVPSLMASYKQGDYLFKDFTAWYHNSLGSHIRYGWVSKLRSQMRTLNFSAYDEQRHQLQVNAELEPGLFQVEVGYFHQLNPLNLFQWDTTAIQWIANDSLRFNYDRWNGHALFSTRDSAGAGSEIFLSIEAGDWSWYQHSARSFRTMAYWSYALKVIGQHQTRIMIGYQADRLGADSFSRPLIELGMSEFTRGDLHAVIGLRYLEQWLPQIKLSYQPGDFSCEYKSLQLAADHMLLRQHRSSLFHQLQMSYGNGNAHYLVGSWTGRHADQDLSGYQVEGDWRFPWDMSLSVAASGLLSDPPAWLFSKHQIQWELNQELLLLDQALKTHLKFWGRHLIDPRIGMLDEESHGAWPVASPVNLNRLDLINYSIDIQVSSLILAFTDANVLQDPLWTNRSAVNWDPEYSIMNNQIPEGRFRYFSLIWVFNN